MSSCSSPLPPSSLPLETSSLSTRVSSSSSKQLSWSVLEAHPLFNLNQKATRVVNPRFLAPLQQGNKEQDQRNQDELRGRLEDLIQQGYSDGTDSILVNNYAHACLVAYSLHAPLVLSPGVLFAETVVSFFKTISEQPENKKKEVEAWLLKQETNTSSGDNLRTLHFSIDHGDTILCSTILEKLSSILSVPPNLFLPDKDSSSPGEVLWASGALAQTANQYADYLCVMCGFPEFVLLGEADEYKTSSERLDSLVAILQDKGCPEAFLTILKKGSGILQLLAGALNKNENKTEAAAAIVQAVEEVFCVVGRCGSGHFRIAGLFADLLSGNTSETVRDGDLDELLQKTHNSVFSVKDTIQEKTFTHTVQMHLPYAFYKASLEKNTPSDFTCKRSLEHSLASDTSLQDMLDEGMRILIPQILHLVCETKDGSQPQSLARYSRTMMKTAFPALPQWPALVDALFFHEVDRVAFLLHHLPRDTMNRKESKNNTPKINHELISKILLCAVDWGFWNLADGRALLHAFLQNEKSDLRGTSIVYRRLADLGEYDILLKTLQEAKEKKEDAFITECDFEYSNINDGDKIFWKILSTSNHAGLIDFLLQSAKLSGELVKHSCKESTRMLLQHPQEFKKLGRRILSELFSKYGTVYLFGEPRVFYTSPLFQAIVEGTMDAFQTAQWMLDTFGPAPFSDERDLTRLWNAVMALPSLKSMQDTIAWLHASAPDFFYPFDASLLQNNKKLDQVRDAILQGFAVAETDDIRTWILQSFASYLTTFVLSRKIVFDTPLQRKILDECKRLGVYQISEHPEDAAIIRERMWGIFKMYGGSSKLTKGISLEFIYDPDWLYDTCPTLERIPMP